VINDSFGPRNCASDTPTGNINSARFPYSYVIAPYTGKPTDEKNAKYYAKGVDDTVKYLVEQLKKVQICQVATFPSTGFTRLFL